MDAGRPKLPRTRVYAAGVVAILLFVGVGIAAKEGSWALCGEFVGAALVALAWYRLGGPMEGTP